MHFLHKKALAFLNLLWLRRETPTVTFAGVAGARIPQPERLSNALLGLCSYRWADIYISDMQLDDRKQRRGPPGLQSLDENDLRNLYCLPGRRTNSSRDRLQPKRQNNGAVVHNRTTDDTSGIANFLPGSGG